MGFALAAYPLTLLNVATKAMNGALDKFAAGSNCEEDVLGFEELKRNVGFDAY